MDVLFIPLANLAGASLDQIKLVFCLLVAYPLGSVFIRIPSSRPELKHIFNIAISVFFLYTLKLYGAFLQLLGDVLVTYFVAKHSKAPSMPWIVFVIVMGHLTVNHVIRVVYGFGDGVIEITGPQMVLTMKLTTFAWNVFDGRRPTEDLDKWQAAKRVIFFPSMLEFLGYCFYFPGMLVGPYLDYASYMDVIHETAFKNLAVKGKNGRNVPSGRKRVAYGKMVMGLIYLAIFVVFGAQWTFTISLTEWFVKQSLLTRIAVFQLAGIITRMKYYAVWTLTEGASILTGNGFTGISPTGKPMWNGAANVDVLSIELPSNFKVLLDSWNMKTNVWLRECVYKRVTPKGKKPGFRSSMITFGTSAFWHGIAIGYYLSFFTGGLITTVGRLSRANIRPLILPPPGSPPTFAKRAYDVLGTASAILILNYAASPFVLLTASNSLSTWMRLGFYGHIMIAGAMAFFYSGGAKYCRRLQAKQASRVQPVEPTTPVNEKQFTIPPPLDQIVPPQ